MKTTLNIKGMHCKSCELLLKDSLNEINVKSEIDHKKGTIIAEFDENKVTLDSIKKVIESEGYKVI